MTEIIEQEKSNEELESYAHKVIDLLDPLNPVEEWKVLDCLLKALTEILTKEGVIVSKDGGED